MDYKKLFIKLAIVLLGLVILAIITLLALYFWPRKTAGLQKADYKTLSYESSLAAFNNEVSSDKQRTNFDETCASKLLTHGKKTKKAVVMMHGITACPNQYDALATKFFDAGYNVYIPLAPHHGTTDKLEHGNIALSELVDYMNTSTSIATGLGDEVGVIGLSGGANLATWMSEYTDVFSRLIVLSPFYEPNPRFAAKWKIPFLLSLYGNNILPDTQVLDFSLRTLAKYVIVRENYKQSPKIPRLTHVAVVTSENDKQIDIGLAQHISKSIADTNNTSYQRVSLPRNLGVNHDIVGPNSTGVKEHQRYLDQLYLNLYENKSYK